jgi:hypothetical protein
MATEQPVSISFGRRFAIWLGLWFTAFIIACVVMFPLPLVGLPFAPIFPVGLCFVFGHRGGVETVGFWALLPYFYYVCLTIIAFRVRRTTAFVTAACILFATLLLNIYGCGLAIDDDWSRTVL